MPVSGISRPLRLRLFLEGQEVPVIGATVSIGLNGPAVASVQVIPLDSGMDLKPRTMVHLFFLDKVPTQDEIIEAKKKNISEAQFRLSHYKLFFTGEVVGFAFAQSPQTRSLVLQCLDFSSYWDACHATAIEYGPNGNAFHNMSSVYGSNASLFDDIVNFQSDRILSWIRDGNPKTPGLQNVSGLAGGIIKILEAMGGINGHQRGVNDFFTFGELRCRLLAQITAEENDKTAATILDARVFDEWLRQGLQNIGQQVTFRDMVKLLCQYIYYDFVPNPVAKYEQSIDGGDEKEVITYEFRSSPLAASILGGLQVITDDYLIPGAKTETYLADQAKTKASWVLTHIVTQSKAVSAIKNDKTSRIINSHLESAYNIIQERIITNAKLTEEDFKGAYTAAAEEVVKARTAASGLPKLKYEADRKSNATTARLRSQIFRPDCFFAAPPRCNVIFPEHFSSVSYDRMYLSEVTRSLTMVYKSLVGRDPLLADKVMAPNIGLDMMKLQKQVGVTGATLLMPHERHTGIVPRSEWLSNVASVQKPVQGGKNQRGARLTWVQRAALFHFFKYRFGPRRANVSGRFNPYLVCGFPSLVILKPFVVPPDTLKEIKAAMGDSKKDLVPEILDLVQTSPEQLGAPYQIIGMIGGLTHAIDQSGGTTTVSLHHARRHLGIDDEFIGVFSSSLGTTQKRVRIPLTAKEAFAQKTAKNQFDLVKALVDATPVSAHKGGSSAESSRLMTQLANKTFKGPIKTIDFDEGEVITGSATETLKVPVESTEKVDKPFVNAKGRIDGVYRNVEVPNPPGKLTTNSKGVFGKIVGVEVTDSDLVEVPSGTYKGLYIYRSVILHEDVDVELNSSVPIEEIIRPSWFSPKYSNPRIGNEIYEPFFGTTSIIDGLKFTGLTADDLVVPDDPEGAVKEPTEKLEKIQSDLKDREATKSRLTIERAVNVIAYLYGLVRTEGKDVDKFIDDYSTRPVANMVDIFGTPDLRIEYDASGKPNVVEGKPGFHSYSIDVGAIQHPKKLAGLLYDPDKQLTRINGVGKREPISPAYDVRLEKYDRVRAYIQALKAGPGLRG